MTYFEPVLLCSLEALFTTLLFIHTRICHWYIISPGVPVNNRSIVITRRKNCLPFLLYMHIYLKHTHYINVYLLFTYLISYFCKIRALYVSWVTSNQFYSAPYLTCWASFGSSVPAMCNCISYIKYHICAQGHELPQGHWQIGTNLVGTLSVFWTTDI